MGNKKEFITLELSEEDARDIVDGDMDDWVSIRKNMIERSRWAVLYEEILQHDNKYYRTSYRRAATESQEGRPFDYEKKVKFTQVEPFEKTITDYKPIEKPSHG